MFHDRTNELPRSKLRGILLIKFAIMNFDTPNAQEKVPTPEKDPLTAEQFRANIETALNKAIQQIEGREETEDGLFKRSDIYERMQTIVCNGLDVEDNINSLYNF